MPERLGLIWRIYRKRYTCLNSKYKKQRRGILIKTQSWPGNGCGSVVKLKSSRGIDTKRFIVHSPSWGTRRRTDGQVIHWFIRNSKLH
jgi:hypothetical protein